MGATLKRKKPQPQFSDFGPAERLARGEVIITGVQQHRRGRAVDIVMTMEREQREAAAWLLALWEAAEYPGYACTKYTRSAGNGGDVPSDRASSARKKLMWVSTKLKQWQWNVIFHVLLMGETHTLFAFRTRTRPRLVTPQLRRALDAVAKLQR